MKLRILNNSLRLRLSQTEVRELATQQCVCASTNFPGGGKLQYCLQLSDQLNDIQASFSDQRILISLPANMANDWANSDTISLRAENTLADGEALSLLIEKDFKCLTDRPHEDESDLFPHPKDGEIAC